MELSIIRVRRYNHRNLKKNTPGACETLYTIKASPLFDIAFPSNFFHSEIQQLLPIDLVSSSTAEPIVSAAAFAFWYFRQREATVNNIQ